MVLVGIIHITVRNMGIAGLYGPMVIYGPLQPEVDYDYDVGPVMISDYFHMSYYEGLKVSFAKPPQALNVSNNLINGKGAYAAMSPLKWMATVCAGAGISEFRFHSGSFIDSGLSMVGHWQIRSSVSITMR